MKPRVVIGLLGTILDAKGQSKDRWRFWRPTVSLCQHRDLPIARLELLYPPQAEAVAQQVQADIGEVSPATQVALHPFPQADPWDLEEVYSGLADFAQAYPFAPEHEDYLVHITTGTHIAQICMFLLCESRMIPARLIQTSPREQGGRDPRYSLIDLDLSKYDRLAARFAREQQGALSALKSGIDTRNAAFNRLIERIEQVAARTRDALLLNGATGTGKSQLARKIYAFKHARRQVEGAFVEVNCATLRGDSAMSTLFGHVKGAFTGALEARPGLLKKSHGGLLFLDEIGELGLDEQAMLLHAIEDKTFYAVGSDKETQSDFQLIAGTHRDLHAQVQRGAFREDLLARIDTWTFQLPSLAARPEDIAPNLDYELAACSRHMGEHITLTREARARFLAFATAPQALWRANFRDFGAAVRRMATLAPAGRIGVAEVDEEAQRLLRGWTPTAQHEEAAPWEALLPADLDAFDRVQLQGVLRECAQSASLSEAGRRLFAASRARKKAPNDADRLRKYLARFGLTWAEVLRGGAR